MRGWDEEVAVRLRLIAAELRLVEEYRPVLADEFYVDVVDSLGDLLRDAERVVRLLEGRLGTGVEVEIIREADCLLHTSIEGRKLLQRQFGLLRRL